MVCHISVSTVFEIDIQLALIGVVMLCVETTALSCSQI